MRSYLQPIVAESIVGAGIMLDRVRFGVTQAVVAVGYGTANVGIVTVIATVIASKASVAGIGDWRFGDIARWQGGKFRC